MFHISFVWCEEKKGENWAHAKNPQEAIFPKLEYAYRYITMQTFCLKSSEVG